MEKPFKLYDTEKLWCFFSCYSSYVYLGTSAWGDIYRLHEYYGKF